MNPYLSLPLGMICEAPLRLRPRTSRVRSTQGGKCIDHDGKLRSEKHTPHRLIRGRTKTVNQTQDLTDNL